MAQMMLFRARSSLKLNPRLTIMTMLQAMMISVSGVFRTMLT